MQSLRCRAMFATLLIGSILSGCTTSLDVKKVSNVASTHRGLAYSLPFTQFTVKLTWSISCTGTDNIAEIAIKAEQSSMGMPDNDHVYAIDYTSLNSAMKTSSVKADFYDNGALKSINTAAEDRTAEVIVKTVSAIGKIAKFVAVAGVAPPTVCSSEIVDQLGKIRGLKADIEKLNQTIEQNLIAVEALTARVVRGGEQTPEDIMGKHQTAIDTLSGNQIDLQSKKRQLEVALKGVSYSTEVIWPVVSSDFASADGQGQKVPISVLRQWLRAKNGAVLADLTDGELKGKAADKAVFFKLDAPGSYGSLAGANTDRGKPEDGVRYRFPAQGNLLVCSRNPCPDTPDEQLVARFATPVLQKGQIFYLPFASEPFSNGSLVAEFNPNGTIKSAGYERKTAAAETAANAADQVADTLVSVGTAFLDAKKTPLEKLKEQTDLAKAEKDLADAQKALIESPNSASQLSAEALAADTAVKQAELANIQADIALRKAREERDKLDQTDDGA